MLMDFLSLLTELSTPLVHSAIVTRADFLSFHRCLVCLQYLPASSTPPRNLIYIGKALPIVICKRSAWEGSRGMAMSRGG